MNPTVETAIIGTGFSGICMGIRLRMAESENFVLLEKSDEIGGTWRDNTYPGAACDVKSHLYSFSFEPNPQWSRVFSGQTEILAYLKHCVDKHQLRKHIRFGWKMTGARYDDHNSLWHIQKDNGDTLTCRFLIMGNGALHIPHIPALKGLETFQGPVFHSAEWNHEAELKNKRIAVIGTGASAIQFVPEIAPQARNLFLFQRTAPWIMPKPDGEISAFRKKLFRVFPFLQKLYRSFIYWFNESQVIAFVINRNLMKFPERIALSYLKKKVKDPVLRQKLTPNFTFGCKRVLLTNNYYDALTLPQSEVITEAIHEITPDSVITENGTYPADVLIFGTGFHVSDSFRAFQITGKNGLSLNALWDKGPEAYLGTCVAGFPNLFFMTGPNTGLGHSSMVYMIESQAAFIMDYLKNAQKMQVSGFEVKVEAQQHFNREVDKKMEATVWKSGCNSWYLAASGRNVTLWPGFTFSFRRKTRKMNLNDFEVVK
ncbi:MAG: NAD(P)/FAD-dependent oxidoreductase [Flavobacteriales bacterium]|nr:NAD(P)/FAD-dependent oxidoreductase [Flavobacteriales bacterium]